jgi:hypothetical protein
MDLLNEACGPVVVCKYDYRTFFVPDITSFWMSGNTPL